MSTGKCSWRLWWVAGALWLLSAGCELPFLEDKPKEEAPAPVPCGGACPVTECVFGMCIGGASPDPVPAADASDASEDDVPQDAEEPLGEDAQQDASEDLPDAAEPEEEEVEEAPEPECLADSDCEEGQWCDAGLCLDGCRDDEGCVLGKVCQEHQCVVGCADDARCPLGKVCLENQCTSGCRQDDQCGNNKICLENQCERGCREDDQCRTRYICLENQCERGCRGDANCPEGEICMDGQCAQGCRMDAVCPDEQFCDPATLACADGCRAGACGLGAGCDLLTRQCVEGVCESSAQCPQGQYCDTARRLAACAPGCDADEQCGPLVCDRPSHACVCRTDEHCGPEQVCVDGGCTQGCQEPEDCAPGTYCDPQMRVCRQGCLDDDFEPNDDPFEASVVGLGRFDAAMCYQPGQLFASDCYQLELVRGADLLVTATFEHARGDLDLGFYSQDGRAVLRSTSRTDNESILLENAEAGRYIFCLEPQGDEPFQMDYGLSLEEPCQPDAGDLQGDATCQQAAQHAVVLGPQQTLELLDRALCDAQDADHAALELSAGDTVFVDIGFRNPQAFVEAQATVAILGPDCQEVVLELTPDPQRRPGSFAGQWTAQQDGVYTLSITTDAPHAPLGWDAFLFR